MDSSEQKEKPEPIKYTGPLPNPAGSVESILKDLFDNPFNIKNGEPWLTETDIQEISEKMKEVIQAEADDIYSEFEIKVEERAEERFEDFKEELKAKNLLEVGLSFAETEKILEHLKNYREMLQKYKHAESGLETIELRQLEYKLTEQIQTNKNW